VTAEGIVIERSVHAQGFVVVGNDAARDSRLSFRARGLHHYLLSLPPGWRVTTVQLGKDNPEGREAIRTALNELVKLGYVTRAKRQDERGRWYTTMTVHDKPQDVTPGDDPATATEDGFPGTGNPDSGELGAKQKTVTENGKDQEMAQGRASWRAQTFGSREPRTVGQVVADIRQAVAGVHSEAEADELTDGQVLGLYFTYANPKKPARDLVAYMSKILGDAPYLDTLMASVEPVCVPCWQFESNCRCEAA
jgi:hypothetical protein